MRGRGAVEKSIPATPAGGKESYMPRLSALSLCAAFTLLTSAPAAAHIYVTYMPVAGVPECSDFVDNDFDGATDLSDAECASAEDRSEALPGDQRYLQRVPLILWQQFLPAPNRIFNPYHQGYGLSIIDVEHLATTPLEQIVDTIHPDWDVIVEPSLGQTIPGVMDNPNIPNLRLVYLGSQDLGPGPVGTVVEFTQGLMVDTTDVFVGYALDVQTGLPVFNIDSIGNLAQ